MIKCHNAGLVFDPSSPDVDMNYFESQDWTISEFGHLLEEDSKPERPSDMPAPRVIGFTVCGKARADHATYAVTRNIRMG